MMHDGLSVGEPSLLEITDNQNSMGAADRQLHPIPSLILYNFFATQGANSFLCKAFQRNDYSPAGAFQKMEH